MRAAVPAETWLFLAVAVATVPAMVVFEPGPAAQALVLAPVVALLGLPHGGLDLHLARALWPLPHARQLVLFALAYLGLAAAVLGIWWQAPGIALAAFLLYSALHFGGDWRAALPLPSRFLAGSMVVGLPALAWPAEVALIFTVLAPAGAAEAAMAVMRGIVLVAGPLLALVWWRSCRHRPAALVAVGEWGTLVAAALLLPPLMYFLVYFCFLHAPRHLRDASQELALTLGQAIRAALPLTLASWALAVIALYWLRASGLEPTASTLNLVFVGLAALAVPHMILVERFWTRSA